MKKVLLAVLALVLAAAGWLTFELNSRPPVDRYASLALPDAPASASGLTVTFLGVSTLLLRDATTTVMIDGFFSRPGLLATAGDKIAPDGARIDAALERAGVDHLDAIFTAHSHYDHAMDAPEVARRTGALVVGSPSTANIARGLGLDDDRIRVVRGQSMMTFGDLTISMIPSKHFPHGKAMGEITAPLVPPARAGDYLEGGSYSILVERGTRSLLVQASAGYVEGALAGRHADVVYLGVGLLGSKDEAYRDAYWREVVSAVGAKRVIPVHWDDFTRGLDQPLVALPRLLDDLGTSMDFVAARAARDHVDLRWPILWQKTDPFTGL